MEQKTNKVVFLFNFSGLFTLFTVIVFYLLILRIYYWNGFELPYWKHPLKSEIPFSFHNTLQLFLFFLSKNIMIPCTFISLFYLLLSCKIKLLNRSKLILVSSGIILFFITELLDPFRVYDWWMN